MIKVSIGNRLFYEIYFIASLSSEYWKTPRRRPFNWSLL